MKKLQLTFIIVKKELFKFVWDFKSFIFLKEDQIKIAYDDFKILYSNYKYLNN